jgi:error-prone DNA polymerase
VTAGPPANAVQEPRTTPQTGRFAELLGRSCFSFLEGASHPEEVVKRAHDLSLEAVALCDRDGLYGSVRAHTEARNIGQRLIVGAELRLDQGSGLADSLRVALLVEDHQGYQNLCRLLTRAHADHDKGEASIGVGQIAELAAGLTAVLPLDDDSLCADSVLGVLRDAFGDRTAVATWRHLTARDADRAALAGRAQERYGVRVVASARPLYHHAERKPLADVLHCIRHKTTLDRAGTALGENSEAYLRSAAQMHSLFRDHPDWVEGTLEIAGRCRFSLDEVRYRFPSEELCLDGETADQTLRRFTEEGCLTRYPEGTPRDVTVQIERELELIAKLDVAPFFLSVHQVVNMARRRRILCQGRGSAANSAVCFALGVTAVDPARSNLLFERFLSAERAEPPDIDVDFEHERREEVIQEIYERYGRDRAAMVSEVISYRGKSALREVGKVFGLSLDQVDRLSGIITHHHDPDDLSAARVAECGLDPRDIRLRQALLLAGELEGFPRHLSIHVGGFVLSAEPLDRVAPIEPARMEGRTVIPWDKDDIEDLGFFKVDVLGLGMLTAIRKTLSLLHENGTCPGQNGEGSPEPFDPIEALAAIPPEDPVVYDAIGHADTVGVFQIESRAQMAMLPRLLPREFYDLVIEVAIVRPGPIQGGMVHPYLRRRTGEEAPTSPHPCLDPILRRTLGVPLFQEQVMQIAMVGAGYTAGEADQLRRDMAAWKKTGRLERHRPRLLSGFAAKGISARFGEMLYQQIQGFGEYGFPESHAASFALLVYASAWLKVHHPAAFACSLLNSQPMGFYSASSLVRDAQRHGVEARAVCVLYSGWDCLLEPLCAPDRSGSSGDGALRLGMRLVKGFGEAAAYAVMEARRDAPFADMSDLVRRAGLKKNEVEALAESGALAAILPARREALWRARAPKVEGLFEGLSIEAEEEIGLPPLQPIEQLVLDYGRVGLSLYDHPVRHLREQLGKKVRRAEELIKLRDGMRITVAGLVVGRQRPGTASGVTFVSLEDETGIINVVVTLKTFNANYLVARHAKLMLVQGKLERKGEVIHVLAQKLERLELPGREVVPTNSRDFH